MPELTELRVLLNAPSIPKGDTTRARLTGLDQFGNGYPTGPVEWRSEDTAVASVTTEGLLRGRSHGSTRIVGLAGGLSGAAAITIAGTLHDRSITTSEVWTTAAAPHVVQGHLSIGDPAGVTLTIEAGVTVVMRTDSRLDFGIGGPGTLIADGTTAPILLRGVTDVGSTWGGVTFRGPGQAVLRRVTLRDCGGTFFDPAVCIALRDSGGVEAPTILIDDVVIRDGDGSGLTLEGRARFAAGAQRLSVQNMAGVAAILPVPAAGGFPLGGSIFGNGTNEIWLRDTLPTSGDILDASTTWGNAGVPWHVFNKVFIEGPETPILTIAAGTTVIFDFDCGLMVGAGGPGGLRIGGAVGERVVLTGEGGDTWRGLHFFAETQSSTVTRTLMRRCGNGNAGCVLLNTDGGQGAPAVVLDSVQIVSPDGLGVIALRYGRFGPGSRALSISGSSGYPMMLWTGAVSTIPPGSSFTGNAQDVILIPSEDVTESTTWPNPGVPYGIVHLLVANASNPILTLEPGVVLKFNQYGTLNVGVGAPGGLRALGTEQSPVTFTSYSATPYPGFWNGLVIGSMTDSSTLLDHVIVNDAGSFDGVSLQAAIKVSRDYGEIVRSTLIRRSADCGIARLSGTPWTTDFTAPHLGNTFQDNQGPAQCGP